MVEGGACGSEPANRSVKGSLVSIMEANGIVDGSAFEERGERQEAHVRTVTVKRCREHGSPGGSCKA